MIKGYVCKNGTVYETSESGLYERFIFSEKELLLENEILMLESERQWVIANDESYKNSDEPNIKRTALVMAICGLFGVTGSPTLLEVAPYSIEDVFYFICGAELGLFIEGLSFAKYVIHNESLLMQEYLSSEIEKREEELHRIYERGIVDDICDGMEVSFERYNERFKQKLSNRLKTIALLGIYRKKLMSGKCTERELRILLNIFNQSERNIEFAIEEASKRFVLAPKKEKTGKTI